MRHSGLPPPVEAVVAALPHDAHPMSVLLAGIVALGACHPEANPATAGGGVYNSRAVQDKQIVRLLGKVRPRGGELSSPDGRIRLLSRRCLYLKW